LYKDVLINKLQNKDSDKGEIRNDIAYAHAPLFKKFVVHGFVVVAPA